MKTGCFETRTELEHFVRQLYASTTKPRSMPDVGRYCRVTVGVVNTILRKGLRCPPSCSFCTSTTEDRMKNPFPASPKDLDARSKIYAMELYNTHLKSNDRDASVATLGALRFAATLCALADTPRELTVETFTRTFDGIANRDRSLDPVPSSEDLQ